MSGNDIRKTGKKLEDYKFWSTQPVPQTLGQSSQPAESAQEDGPLKQIDVEKVQKEPYPMAEGFEWVVMDLEKQEELDELYELLAGHYVEDTDGTFRFNYSREFLSWALKPPGWVKDWHVGVRARAAPGKIKGKLVASICGVPVDLRVRGQMLKASEINFLAIHIKLRSKRLAPLLIKEVTRRCYLKGVFQALYTAGTLLPTPVSTCRYWHRPLDWEKLYSTGFSHLPPNSSVVRQRLKYKLPEHTATNGLRPMKPADVPAVKSLLDRYLERFDLGQELSEDEVRHWLCSDASKNVVYAHVVEKDGKITDFISYYLLESQVLQAYTKTNIRAAYMLYYATETAFRNLDGNHEPLKSRLNELVHDMVILAKKEGFDVMNALSLLDNPLFLEEQKFGAGDGNLHFYLYNYRTPLITGGIDENNRLDPSKMGGVGVVML